MADRVASICDVIVVDIVPDGQCTHLLLTAMCESLQDAGYTHSAAHKVVALSLLSALLQNIGDDASTA